MHSRRIIGVIAAGLSIAALVVAAQGLVPSINAALINYSPSLAGGGLVTAGLMLCVAGVMAKLAYRNLFWARYVAAQRHKAKAATR